MKKITLFFGMLLLFSCNGFQNQSKQEANKEYESSWESLAQHNEEPDWLKDAKFGIYFHWGVYSVPAFGNEWYPRNMHFEKRGDGPNPVFDYHVENYGHPSEFGYHDFVPMFKAENFNAEEWADLFVKAGARFAGPVAEHHDGFSMWDSKVTPWNAAQKGPQRDITGELAKAIKQRELKFITTFHHARNLQRYKNKTDEVNFGASHYPLIEGMSPMLDDTELNYLYGNIPEEEWLEDIWFGKLKEVIDQYEPDIVWFDSWLDRIPIAYRQKFCAYYLNEARKLDKEVVIIRKQKDLPLGCSIDDLEKSRMNRIKDQLWMTDETMSTGSWCYTQNLKIKPTQDLIHVLVDIVSKNGVLLLNISPKADGTIPVDQKNSLLAMGDWLSKYGEAIYDTRPWYTYGEGPTKEPEGSFKNHAAFQKIKYTKADVRFTVKDNFIYIITLGEPVEGESYLLNSFSPFNWTDYRKIKTVNLLDSNVIVDWEVTDLGLQVTVPEMGKGQMAVAFKVELE